MMNLSHPGYPCPVSSVAATNQLPHIGTNAHTAADVITLALAAERQHRADPNLSWTVFS